MADDKMELITPPTSLRDKVRVVDGDGFDSSATNNVITELGVQFESRLPSELGIVRSAFDALQDAPADEAAKRRLFRIVHDLKGQAGTFNFNLITVIGNDLCRFIEQPVDLNPRRLQVIGFHIAAMGRVATQRIMGYGGDQGMRMVNTLQGMTHKVLTE